MPHAYPLMLDLTDRLVVIIGGGAVAARKARGVVEAGARRVRAVAREFHAEMPSEIERITGSYDPEHLNSAGLVFAATDDPAVNAAVVRDARSRSVLVNRADGDDDEPGDFSTPAKLLEGSLTITVSAGSAALSAMIRDRLKELIDPRWLAMADAMQTIRPAIRKSIPDTKRRRAVLLELASEESMVLLAREGPAGLTRRLAERYPELRQLAESET